MDGPLAARRQTPGCLDCALVLEMATVRWLAVHALRLARRTLGARSAHARRTLSHA